MTAAVGIMIEGQEGLDWPRWRRLCRDVEALGFDSLWRSDHLFSVLGVEGRADIETWVSMALAAEWTSRIEFGTLVSPLTFHRPALLARMAASVDAMAGGRLVLGVGAGWYEEEHRRFQLPFPPLRERMEALERGLPLIRRVADEALPPPGRRLPLLVGGPSRRTLRIAAWHADEWNAHNLEPDVYAERCRELDRLCEQRGRARGAVRRSLMKGHIVGRSRAEVLERAAALRSHMPALAERSPEDIVRDPKWLAGTPGEVIAAMKRYVEAGVSRFMLQHHLMDDHEALELIGREIVPALA